MNPVVRTWLAIRDYVNEHMTQIWLGIGALYLIWGAIMYARG
jgi:hypothetical protein